MHRFFTIFSVFLSLCLIFNLPQAHATSQEGKKPDIAYEASYKKTGQVYVFHFKQKDGKTAPIALELDASLIKKDKAEKLKKAEVAQSPQDLIVLFPEFTVKQEKDKLIFTPLKHEKDTSNYAPYTEKYDVTYEQRGARYAITFTPQKGSKNKQSVYILNTRLLSKDRLQDVAKALPTMTNPHQLKAVTGLNSIHHENGKHILITDKLFYKQAESIEKALSKKPQKVSKKAIMATYRMEHTKKKNTYRFTFHRTDAEEKPIVYVLDETLLDEKKREEFGKSLSGISSPTSLILKVGLPIEPGKGGMVFKAPEEKKAAPTDKTS